MEYLDNQAEESEDETSDTSINRDKPKGTKRKIEDKKKEKEKKKRRQIQSSDEEDDDEDDEAKAREEMKGFIADEEEEEGGDDAVSEKSDKDENLDELDEDDLDLIEENLNEPKKPRIVQTFDSDDSDIEADDRTRIGQNLFGDGDDNDEVSSRRNEPIDPSSDEEGSDDFIVNEDGHRRPKRRHPGDHLNIPEGALEEARDIFGVEEFDLNDFYEDEPDEIEDEEEEILDEDGEGVPIRRVRKIQKKGTIYDTMDPVELEKGFMNTFDQKVMITDVPERFQLRRVKNRVIDDAELELETHWVYRFGFNDDFLTKQASHVPTIILSKCTTDEERTQAKEATLRTIKETIRFIRNSEFEIPFIFHYRKEDNHASFSMEELWRVYEYDMKWLHLKDRKEKILELMKRMRNFQIESQSAKHRQVTESDIYFAQNTESEEAIADVYSQFQLYHGADIGKMMEWEKARKGETDPLIATKFKFSSRKDRYQFCYEHGIGGLANRFGLTARQFADNLDWKRHEVIQDELDVQNAAEEYICNVFPNAQSVLESAAFMVATELSRQPLVREKVRKAFRRRARLYVRPTKAGRAQIDDSHPMFYKRYIKEKPIYELEDEEFLYYWKLKDAGLLIIRIEVDTEENQRMNETLADEILLDGPYTKEDYTELVENWNNLRKAAVKRAVNEMLIPFLKHEMEKRLIDEAKNCVARKCSENLAKRLEMQGYHVDHINDDDDQIGRPGDMRIMAVAYPDDMMEASFGAVVNQDGAMLDYVRMVHFLKRSDARDSNQKNQKDESMNIFKKMIDRKRPHVVGLCAQNMEAIRLKKDLEHAISEMYNDRQISHIIDVVFMECDVPKLYMNSKQALVDFPDYPPILRMAICGARMLVDPMVEIAALFNFEEDILCLSFHPLQKDLDKEALTNALTKEMMHIVSEHGVDFNRALDQSHYAHILQFVSGLGPRKSAAVLKDVRHECGVLGSRTVLVTGLKLGPKTFMNCAGYLQINPIRLQDHHDEFNELLDSTRIHPETYEWARKMAVDALEVDDNADPQAALEELMNAPERLKDLDLDAFADELMRQGFGEKRATLYDIATELHSRFKDKRKPFEPMTVEQLYDILARELKDILRPGKLIQGTVVGIQHRRLTEEERQNSKPSQNDYYDGIDFTCQYCNERIYSVQLIWNHLDNEANQGGCPGVPVGVKVRLVNGFNGFIPKKFISSDPNSFKHPLERVQIGKPIWCKIKDVNVERFSCTLTCRSQDLQGDNTNEKDRYWDHEAEDEDRKNEAFERKKKTEQTTVIKRVIQHQAFQNISYHDAQRQLAKADQGECIIRPSSKSPDKLTATWKVADGVFANVEIQEEDKEKCFTLGRRLIINGEEFEDLNEIIARYIQPMANHARDIVLYKYYLDGVYAEEVKSIEMKLREERQKNPSRIPYFLTPSTKWPGKFMLSFAHPKLRAPLHEYMTVTPDGIRFRQRVFTTFDQLLAWFKVHFSELPIDRNQYHR